MERSYIKYLLFGILFVGMQEFWVNVIWRGNLISFILAIVILDFIFVSITYHVSKFLDKKLPGIADIIIYLMFGIIGLVFIEWILWTNAPGQTEANQFVMFTTWAGTAIFARIFTDKSNNLEKIKKYLFRYFIFLTGTATLIGIIFLAINPQISFIVTFLAANIGYPLMIPFFIWYFIKKLNTKK